MVMERLLAVVCVALLWSRGAAQSSDAGVSNAGGTTGPNVDEVALLGAPPLILPSDSFVTSLSGLGTTPIGVTPLTWCAPSSGSLPAPGDTRAR